MCQPVLTASNQSSANQHGSRSRIFVVACMVGLTLLHATCGQSKSAFPHATPESQGVATAAVQRIASEVEGYVKDGTIVGGELLIVKNRKTILHQAFGDRDREQKQAMQPGTIFNIRSMTKPLTGVAVQMLADEGKIRLDDPVAKYLPGFDHAKSKQITIEQLLQHRSGLPLTILTFRLDAYPDLQAQAKAIGEQGPQHKPGEKFWYSDAGSDVAAALVERITGKKIDEFIAERILQPLEMTDSLYISIHARNEWRVCTSARLADGFGFGNLTMPHSTRSHGAHRHSIRPRKITHDSLRCSWTAEWLTANGFYRHRRSIAS